MGSRSDMAALNSTVASCPGATSLIVLVTVAVAIALPLIFPGKYPDRPEAFGANWGLATLSGQWWRLFSYNFVHISVVHLTGNMAALWILGKRLERAWGHWIMLLSYLSCGLVAGMYAVAAHPLSASYGASTCVAGVTGALCVIYGIRLRSLAWKTRWKLLALALFALAFVWEDMSAPRNFEHSAGLFAGIAIALFFTYFASTPRSRYWTFAGILALLAIAGSLIHHHYRVVGLIS